MIPVTDVLFRRCLRQLRLICGHHNVLPLSYITREGLKRVNNSPVAGGGFADVWEGTYEGRTVCVKVLRIENENTKTTEQRNALAVCNIRGLLVRPSEADIVISLSTGKQLSGRD